MALTQVTSIGLKDGEIVNADLHSAASVALSKLASTGALGSAVTATTQSASDDSTKLATTAFVQAAVTSLIDGAPGSLNTLNELAAAINDDSSYATTLTTALATKAVLSGSTNNTICTVTGANAIQGEANLTFDGTDLLPATGESQSLGGASNRWKKLYLAQGGELHFGDTSNTNFFGITEGTVNQFSDQDKLGIYFRQELNFYSSTNTLRTTISQGGNITLVTGNLYGNTSNTTEIGSYTSPVGAIKRIRMCQGGELHFGDTTTSNFLGITEGTVDQFTDRDRLGIYYRNELKFYSNQNSLRLTFEAGGSIGQGTSTPRTPDGSNADNPLNGDGTNGDPVFTIYGDSPAINLISSTTGTGDYSLINFGRTGSSTNPYRAIIGYKQSDDLLRINAQNSIVFDTGGDINTNERLRVNSDGRLFLGSGVNSNADTYKMSIKESSSENAAIMFLDTDNMKGGLCGISKGNNELISGTTNVDFVVGSMYADTHIIASPANNANTVIAMTVQHDRIQLWENVLISNNVVLTGNTNSNIINERVQILPSENNGYDDSHILSAVQTSGNWEQGNSSSNPSSSWGWIWQYANANNGTKQVRSGIAYDHKGTEEFKYWSSYGDHTWYVDSGASGDETAETCDKKAMQICRQGSVINTANPTYGIYTHTGVQTSDGGSKTVQYLEDCMGQWIVVAKIQQASHLQAAMASVAQIDTSINHNTGTEWSSSFGTTYPIAVRYVSSSNWKNWRDHRGVDFIQGVPHGRQWRHFFTNGASSGMTTATGGVGSTKYGWTCDGCWDGKGRWHNPTFNWWRMSDHGSGFSNDYVSASFFTTPTAANASTALNLNWANDAKFGVHHSGATGGQDTEVTSVYGWDDNTYGHEDNYPNSPSNNSGSDIGAMNLWICINVSAVGQFH